MSPNSLRLNLATMGSLSHLATQLVLTKTTINISTELPASRRFNACLRALPAGEGVAQEATPRYLSPKAMLSKILLCGNNA
jgi:hypothetical protein